MRVAKNMVHGPKKKVSAPTTICQRPQYDYFCFSFSEKNKTPTAVFPRAFMRERDRELMKTPAPLLDRLPCTRSSD